MLSFSGVLKVANFFLPYLCSVFLLLGRKPVARILHQLCKVLLPISSLVVHKYIARLWGVLRECTLGRSGSYVSISMNMYITKILARVVQVDAFYYQSLSWLHLRCDGSCLLYKLCQVGILV